VVVLIPALSTQLPNRPGTGRPPDGLRSTGKANYHPITRFSLTRRAVIDERRRCVGHQGPSIPAKRAKWSGRYNGGGRASALTIRSR
jgi:hypothetical protein